MSDETADLRFDELREVTFSDAIRLRVPARWSSAQSQSGMWCCYEEAMESGTFWVDYEVFDIADPSTGDADGRARRAIDLFAQEVLDEFVVKEGHHREERVDLADGVLLRLEEDGEEAGERLRVHRWTYFKPAEGRVLTVFFALVLRQDQAEDPRFADLVEILDREVRAAELRMPRPGSRA